MKIKFKRATKRSLSIVLVLLMTFSTLMVGTITASAFNIGGSSVKFYYADTDSWGAVNMYYWGSDWNNNADFTKISNTNIFVYSFSSTWTNLTGYKFRSDSNWTKQSSDNITSTSTSSVWFSGTSTTKHTSLANLNGTAKIVSKLSTSGTYSETADSSCVAKVSGYTLSSGATSATATSSSTGSSSSASISAAYGSTITYSGTAGSGYVFKGFSTSNTSSLPSNVKTSLTTTATGINGSSNTTYYAYFEKTDDPVATSVSLTPSSTTVEKNKPITLTATLTGQNASSVTYTFNNTSSYAGSFGSSSTVTTTDSTATTTFTPTATGTYTFKVVVSATGYSSVEKTVSVTVEEPAVYYIEGRFHYRDSNDKVINTFDSGDWDDDSTNIPLSATDTDGLYKLETNMPLSELTNKISGYTPYFYIRKGTASSATGTSYYASSTTTLTLTNKSVTLGTSGANNNLCFNDSSDKGPVTLYFNANTKQLYYEIPAYYTLKSTTHTNCTVNFYSDSGCTTSVSEVQSGTTVYVKVTPSTNYEISSVTGDNATPTAVSGSTGVYTFTMPSANVDITAIATLPSYTLTIGDTYTQNTTASGYNKSATGGTYSVAYGGTSNATSAGTYSANNGQTITLTATPKTGFTFAGWSTKTNATGLKYTGTTATFTMSGDITLYPIFNRLQYALTTSQTNCTVSYTSTPVDSATNKYCYGATVKFTVDDVPTGYTLAVTRSDTNATLSPKDGSYSFTMPASALTISAVATENLYNVTVDDGSGTNKTVKAGIDTQGSATATDIDGYKLDSWTLSDGVTLASGYSASDTTIKFNATATGTVTANYVPEDIYLWSYVNGTEKIEKMSTTGDGTYVLTTYIENNDTYLFFGNSDKTEKKWYLNDTTNTTGTKNVSVTVDTDYNVKSRQSTDYERSFKFTPDSGTYTITLDFNTMKFKIEKKIFTVTVTAGTGGKVKKDGGNLTTSVTANSGDTITATANTGYAFDHWETSGACSVTSTTDPSTTVTATAEGGTVTAVFKKTYTVGWSVVAADTATITGSWKESSTATTSTSFENGASLKEGSVVTLTATLASGYEPLLTSTSTSADIGAVWVGAPSGATVTYNSTTGKATCTFTVSSDTEITFNTKKINYTITYVNTPTTGGSSQVQVSSKNVTSLNIGDKFTVVTTPKTADGYEVASVVVKAGTATLTPSNNVYTMTTGNVTVTTTYRAITPTITTTKNTIDVYAGDSYNVISLAGVTTDYGTLSVTDTNNGKAPEETTSYTVTVTATNSPSGVTAATSTKTITINVSLTTTQQAYKDLVSKFEDIGQEQAEYYKSGTEWTAYVNAVSAAQTLINNGFPSSSATNTTDYTTAQTTLEDAYKAIQSVKNTNVIYVLSQYDKYVDIYMFNNTSGESYSAVNGTLIKTGSEKNGKNYSMEKLGEVTIGSNKRYLYKFEYTGKGDFIIYGSTSKADEVIGSGNKLTGDVTTCKGFTSYFFDLSAVSFGSDTSKTTADISPYVPLEVTLKSKAGEGTENVTYDLTGRVNAATGTLVDKNATVTTAYVDNFGGESTVISSPSKFTTDKPGIHTITITSTNGVETVTNTFTLYVKDKLDQPVLTCSNQSTKDGAITVNVSIDEAVTITASSSGEEYPEGTTYQFTIDGVAQTAQDSPVLKYDANTLSLGEHTFTVTVIRPTTKFAGTNYYKYVNPAKASNTLTINVQSPKVTINYDFTNSHVTTSITYKSNNANVTATDLSGKIYVDKDTTVKFTVAMTDGYEPIPNINCWSGGSDDATISSDKLTYTFTATESTTVVFKSYKKAQIKIVDGTELVDSKNINIGGSVQIKITTGTDADTNYVLCVSKDGGTTYETVTSYSLSNNVYTIQRLSYGKYKYRLSQYTNDYDDTSNVVSVNAVNGSLVLEYSYQEYNSDNGTSYDPYIGLESNLKSEVTTYQKTIEEYNLSTITDSNYNEIYAEYAPNLEDNYFDYKLSDSGITRSFTSDKKTCTIKGSVMTPTEKKYSVTVIGDNTSSFESYYQQKTFLLNAEDYCNDSTSGHGYVWYYLNSDNTMQVLSTSQYYKLRVVRDTVLYVKPLDETISDPTTTINVPVYNEVVVSNVLKVQMNMLVENYLPDGATKTRTGTVYCVYDTSKNESAPNIDSTELKNLIADSKTLLSGGSIYTVGTSSDGTTIKGYCTENANLDGKFVFAPSVKLDSTKVYVVYSYLTYTKGAISYTIVSNPVTASAADYKSQQSSTE
jgi:hypothetical protein